MIIEQIAHSAKNNPEKCAIIRGKSKITYFLLWRSIQQALAFFSKHTPSGKGVAAIIIDDSPTAHIIGMALRALGFDTISIKSISQLNSLAINKLSTIVIGIREAFEQRGIAVNASGVKMIIFPDGVFNGDNSSPNPDFSGDPRNGGHILLTSGTTGNYKMILMEGKMEDARNDARSKALGLSRNSIYNVINFAPWAGAGFKEPYAIWHIGGTVVFDQQERYLERLFDHAVTQSFILPVDYPELLNLCERRGAATQAKLASSSGFLSPHIADKVSKKVTPFLDIVFSATELIVPPLRSHYSSPQDAFWLKPVDSASVQVIDENGNPCNNGEEGFLGIKMKSFDPESYLQDKATTAKVFRDGYFYPGDLAIQRPDGRIRVVGRVSDVINIQGQKVATAPLEEEIRVFLKENEVCLFSYQTDLGEDELLIVIERPDAISAASQRELRRQFSGFDSIKFVSVNRFPRTDMGTRKIQRAMLKRIALSSS